MKSEFFYVLRKEKKLHYFCKVFIKPLILVYQAVVLQCGT